MSITGAEIFVTCMTDESSIKTGDSGMGGLKMIIGSVLCFEYDPQRYKNKNNMLYFLRVMGRLL
jgi:hypothetical protein